MTLWAAIPVKPFAEGKSRLAGVLSGAERARLNARLFRRTLAVVAAVVPAEQILVVSRDAAARELAAARGARGIAERGEGMNAALDEALKMVAPGGKLLVVPVDLPFVTAEDLAAMLVGEVAIAPDRAGAGTNALFCDPAGKVPFCFGDGSFLAHAAAARALGIVPEIVVRAGLGFDLDLPEDLRSCPEAWWR